MKMKYNGVQFEGTPSEIAILYLAIVATDDNPTPGCSVVPEPPELPELPELSCPTIQTKVLTSKVKRAALDNIDTEVMIYDECSHCPSSANDSGLDCWSCMASRLKLRKAA